MARSRKKINTDAQPGLFDDLDIFQECVNGDFELIPPEKMEQIAAAIQPDEEIDPMAPVTRDNPTVLMSFGSGSSGNCMYIGTKDEGVLVDAGVELDRVLKGLRDNGLSIYAVKAIVLTHDHGDHIKYAYQIVRKYRHILIHCTLRVLNGILRRHNISRRIKDYHHPIYKEFPFTVAGMELTAFEVKHDGMDNAGYFIRTADRTITIATDLGCISDRAEHYMRQSSTIVIEANYDHDMLREGPYPEYLKSRIISDCGHLDNEVSARFIASIVTPQLTHVFLCHLSHENNTPEKAIEAMTSHLSAAGVTIIGDGLDPLAMPRPQLNLVALPRQEVTPLYIL